MQKLLRLHENQRWNLEGIEWAIAERIGDPNQFVGRVEELEYLYTWADNIRKKISRSLAFLGRRKIGKSLILERLYNIIYSEHKGLIPFYYEFTEGTRSGKEFYHDFVTRFYMQVIGYYMRDISWIRKAGDKETDVNANDLVKEVKKSSMTHKEKLIARLENCVRVMNTEKAPYEYVISAVAAPHGFATMVGVEEQIVQMIDEFQYLNMYIDAGVEDKPSKSYMSTAESKVAPLLITGSLMGVVSEELMRWLPYRFMEMLVPKMDLQETIAMTLNYGRLYDQALTPEIAEYIAYVTNNVPGRIVELLTPKLGKPRIRRLSDVDRALEVEVDQGTIQHDWDEYLSLAMQAVNDVNLRKITFFLCQHEGEWYSPRELQEAMSLELDEQALRSELALLHKYDLVEKTHGRYGGVFDRTLKKVLMAQYRDLFNLPMDEFDAYFRNDNLLDYLQERVTQLELSLAEAEEVRHTLRVLRGEHNDLKGHYYEREVLLELIKGIIDGDGGIVAGIGVTEFTYTLSYHLESGQELDIVLEGEQAVVMAECKHYAPEYLYKITETMVAEFVEKAHRLHTARFPGKELRLGFFSKHGFEEKLKPCLERHGIRFH